MRKKTLTTLALAAFGVVLAAGQALAIPTLRVTVASGGQTNSYTLADEDPLSLVNKKLYGDIFSDSTGSVSWGGALGDWLVTMTGSTKDATGSASLPVLHLNGDATYLGKNSQGTFTLEFSETSFGPLLDSIGLIANLDGSDAYAQSLKVYYDASNTLFGRGALIADLNELGSSYHYYPIPDFNTPFSITMVSTITLDRRFGAGWNTASFDNTVVPNPEPATMLLFGTGLTGLAGAARRRMKKAQNA